MRDYSSSGTGMGGQTHSPEIGAGMKNDFMFGDGGGMSKTRPIAISNFRQLHYKSRTKLIQAKNIYSN